MSPEAQALQVCAQDGNLRGGGRGRGPTDSEVLGVASSEGIQYLWDSELVPREDCCNGSRPLPDFLSHHGSIPLCAVTSSITGSSPEPSQSNAMPLGRINLFSLCGT